LDVTHIDLLYLATPGLAVDSVRSVSAGIGGGSGAGEESGALRARPLASTSWPTVLTCRPSDMNVAIRRLSRMSRGGRHRN
jgi:hypothetical protein